MAISSSISSSEASFGSSSVDPAANCARAAWDLRRVPTEVAFFGSKAARQIRERSGAADLIIANNVLAHVPDINDFVAGFYDPVLANEALRLLNSPTCLK